MTGYSIPFETAAIITMLALAHQTVALLASHYEKFNLVGARFGPFCVLRVLPTFNTKQMHCVIIVVQRNKVISVMVKVKLNPS